MTLVSIVIPAYNAEEYIHATIQSVINQSYNNWELIIIDDGSTDRTASIVQDFLSNEKIKYIHQPNSGVCIARNKGLAVAKGDYIALLDADDIWLKENLKEKIELLISEPTLDWVFSDIYRGDNHLNILEVETGNDNNITKEILLWEKSPIPGICSNIVFKRKCISEGLKFDPSLSTAADLDFSIYLSSKYSGKKISKPLLTYRILDKSMSKNLMVAERDYLFLYKKANNNGILSLHNIKGRAYSNLYLLIAGNWWVNGNCKTRSAIFLLLSFLSHPSNFCKKTYAKIIKRITK